MSLAGARQQLQATVDRLQAQIDDLISRSVSSSRLSSGGAATSVLGSLQQQQSTLQNQIARLDITTALISGDTTVVRRAVPAAESDSPRPFRDAAVAVLLGLVFGISIAIVLGSLQARQSAPGATPPRPDEDENAKTESLHVNGHAPETGNHQAGDPVPTNSGRYRAEHTNPQRARLRPRGRLDRGRRALARGPARLPRRHGLTSATIDQPAVDRTIPPDAVLDVRAVYGARGDGVTDTRPALQRAISRISASPRPRRSSTSRPASTGSRARRSSGGSRPASGRLAHTPGPEPRPHDHQAR